MKLARESALKMSEFMGDDRPVDQDLLIAEVFIVQYLDSMTHEPLANGPQVLMVDVDLLL